MSLVKQGAAWDRKLCHRKKKNCTFTRSSSLLSLVCISNLVELRDSSLPGSRTSDSEMITQKTGQADGARCLLLNFNLSNCNTTYLRNIKRICLPYRVHIKKIKVSRASSLLPSPATPRSEKRSRPPIPIIIPSSRRREISSDFLMPARFHWTENRTARARLSASVRACTRAKPTLSRILSAPFRRLIAVARENAAHHNRNHPRVLTRDCPSARGWHVAGGWNLPGEVTELAPGARPVRHRHLFPAIPSHATAEKVLSFGSTRSDVL